VDSFVLPVRRVAAHITGMVARRFVIGVIVAAAFGALLAGTGHLDDIHTVTSAVFAPASE
jgi:hypothetical protein